LIRAEEATNFPVRLVWNQQDKFVDGRAVNTGVQMLLDWISRQLKEMLSPTGFRLLSMITCKRNEAYLDLF